MAAKRYTLLLADRSTGVVRRVTVSSRTLTTIALLGAGLIATLIVGARESTRAELRHLRAENAALRQENESFRAATGELTSQISSLQEVLAEIGAKTSLDAETLRALNRLPAMVRNTALGGASSGQDTTRALLTLVHAPDSPFGVLRSLLGALEDRLQVVRHDAERVEALADATPSIWPAVGWLTDGVGTRTDPFTGEEARHEGLDIAADKGTPVFAAASGVVQKASWSGDYGNLIVVAHEFGLTTRYAHLSGFAVKPGDTVVKGQVIGYIGATGRASGPHLHYEVWANGRPLNPLTFLTASRRSR